MYLKKNDRNHPASKYNLSIDYRSKPFKLAKVVKIQDSDHLGLVFDTWEENYGAKLKSLLRQHETEMKKASFVQWV